MVRTRRANRYCVDCGSRLVYYPRLSNPKAPNEHRVLVYACPDCTEDFEKPKMFSIRRNQVDDPLETVEIEITQNQKKTNRKNQLLLQNKTTEYSGWQKSQKTNHCARKYGRIWADDGLPALRLGVVCFATFRSSKYTPASSNLHIDGAELRSQLRDAL